MRTVLVPFAAAAVLSLAACTDSSAPDGTGEDAARPAASATASAPATVPGDSASPAPGSPAPAGEPTAARSSPDVDDNPPGDACGASKVAAYVSQEATPAVRARVAADVGHSRIRWLDPDAVITMDFRSDRLNVMLDDNGIITGGKCQ